MIPRNLIMIPAFRSEVTIVYPYIHIYIHTYIIYTHTLWQTNIVLETGPVEIVDLPIKMVDLSIVLCMFTRPGIMVKCVNSGFAKGHQKRQ